MLMRGECLDFTVVVHCRAKDFFRILTEPEHNMIKQQQALIATEGVDLVFTEPAIRRISEVAEEVNTLVDNIGARRLHTILERILEEISFNAPEEVRPIECPGQDSTSRVTYLPAFKLPH